MQIIWDETGAVARAAARATPIARETHLITAELPAGGVEGLCGARSSGPLDGGQWFTSEPGDVTCGFCRAWMTGQCSAWIGAVTRRRRP